jgi:hypothetical protein
MVVVAVTEGDRFGAGPLYPEGTSVPQQYLALAGVQQNSACRCLNPERQAVFAQQAMILVFFGVVAFGILIVGYLFNLVM